MSNKGIQVAHLQGIPGQVVKGRIHATELADGSPVEIPVIIVQGRQDGPTLYVQAGCHGVEVNGMESMRRLLVELDPNELKGTLICVPVANVLAFNAHNRRTPFDNEDMNRVWPGKPDGSLSERIAHAIWSNAIAQADAVVDLHTGGGTMVTHIRMGSDPKDQALAKAFGTPVLVAEALDEGFKRARFDGKMRLVANRHGKPAITPELGGHSRWMEEPIRDGHRGLRNVLAYLGMMPWEIVPPKEQVIAHFDSKSGMRTPTGGLFLPQVAPGDKVKEGQLIGLLVSAATFDVLHEFKSPYDGLIMSYVEHPVVHAGDSVCRVLRF